MSGIGVSRTARGLASLLLAMLFAGAMSVFWLTVSAPSASAATVTEPVEIVDPTAQCSGDGWSWDPAGSAGTLTLEGADIQVADMKDANAAIVVPDGATIHLKGESTIVSAAPSASSSDLLAAIYCEGDLTITGDDTASASIRGEGSLNAGIYCVGDLSIQSGVELNVSAVNDGYAGTFVNGNLVITGGSTVATTGSSEGLVVMGSTNIADAAQVKFGTENATPGDSLAANFTGDVTISGTEVIVSGSGVEFWSTAALVGSEVTMDVDASGAIHAMKGLEITGGSNVSASSSGHVIEILGDMLVQGSILRVEGVGIWDTAITVTDGDLTVDGSSVLEHVLYGAEIQIGAQPDNGYRFVKWESVGAAPEWENGDAAKAEQMVTIVGQATMTPTVEAAAPADPGSGDPGKDSGKGSGKTGLAASGDSADGVVAIAAIAAGIGAAAAAGAAAKRRSRR